MGPEGTNSQDQPRDSDEPILARIERAHRQIVNSVLKELAAAEEPSRIRELLDPLPELLSKHFADQEGPDGLYDGLRAIRPSLDSELKSLRGDHRRVLEAVEARRRGLGMRPLDALKIDGWGIVHSERYRFASRDP